MYHILSLPMVDRLSSDMRYLHLGGCLQMMTQWLKAFALHFQPVCVMACFNVQWCTKCGVMNENVQWWKAFFAVMNH